MQDYVDYEVIIVDNGSTDTTSIVIAELIGKDQRIRSVRLDENQRPAGGRNAGVKAARSDLIAFLDADDEWLPGKLTTQVRLLDAFGDYDLVFSDSWIVNQSMSQKFSHMAANKKVISNLTLSPVLDFEKTFFVSGPVPRMIYTKSFINMSTAMIRKGKFLGLGGFDTDRFGTEDIDFWVRLSKNSRFIYWDEYTALCYQGQGTSKPSTEWLRELIRYHRKSLTSPDYVDLVDVAKQNLEKAYRYMIVSYGLENRPREALNAYRESQDLGFNTRLAIYTALAQFGAWPLKIGQLITNKRSQIK
jgi:glycosyltransferase involved in cell wall biosynthesis